MLRLDRIHPLVSGNKWFKLKYNLEAAAGRRIVTFGGAYSNHIVATAAACKAAGLRCTGIIRGEAPAQWSHTLLLARKLGMALQFVSRELYKSYTQGGQIPDADGAYLVPEGGHNALGARGCAEILALPGTGGFTHIICAVGTGTTMAGLISATTRPVIGIAALKGAFSLETDIAALLPPGHASNWRLLHDFHEGGYAKISSALIGNMNDFYRQTQIPTDRVYTGKMVLAVQKLLAQEYFPPQSKLLLIHSGGLQGNDSLPANVLCF